MRRGPLGMPERMDSCRRGAGRMRSSQSNRRPGGNGRQQRGKQCRDGEWRMAARVRRTDTRKEKGSGQPFVFISHHKKLPRWCWRTQANIRALAARVVFLLVHALCIHAGISGTPSINNDPRPDQGANRPAGQRSVTARSVRSIHLALPLFPSSTVSPLPTTSHYELYHIFPLKVAARNPCRFTLMTSSVLFPVLGVVGATGSYFTTIRKGYSSYENTKAQLTI